MSTCERTKGSLALCLVAAWSPGGLLETPPRWHTTVLLPIHPSLLDAKLGQCKARPLNFVRVCLFLVQPFLVELIGVEFPDETYHSHKGLWQRCTGPPMNKFVCKLHGYIVYLFIKIKKITCKCCICSPVLTPKCPFFSKNYLALLPSSGDPYVWPYPAVDAICLNL